MSLNLHAGERQRERKPTGPPTLHGDHDGEAGDARLAFRVVVARRPTVRARRAELSLGGTHSDSHPPRWWGASSVAEVRPLACWWRCANSEQEPHHEINRVPIVAVGPRFGAASVRAWAWAWAW